jgi:hypothetical protein
LTYVRKFIRSAFGVSLILVIGCYRAEEYSGDGEFADHGIFEANYRYTLDLGPVSLKSPGRYVYFAERLPAKEFLLGVEIRNKSASHEVDPRSISAKVSLSVTNDYGESVIEKKGRLDNWSWTIPLHHRRFFAYGGEGSETAFTPVRRARYRIDFVVMERDASSWNYEARLIAKSQGWK